MAWVQICELLPIDNGMGTCYNVITIKQGQPRKPKALENLKPYTCDGIETGEE